MSIEAHDPVSAGKPTHVSDPRGGRDGSIRARLSRVGLAMSIAISLARVADAQPWVARHGMTSAGYQSEFNKWVRQGFRLTHVSGYDADGTARFAAIWEKKPGPSWVARHGMTSAQYQSEFNKWVGKGYRLVLVDGYESGGSAR